VNLLDENILESQRQLLKNWGVPVRQIGHELGRKGMLDEAIIPFLLTLKQPRLLTRDLGFYDYSLCHERYCLAVLAVRQQEAAHFARAFLRHASFKIRAKRMGTVVRVSHTGLVVWRSHAGHESHLKWH
jgi:hypothetical protein